MSEVTKYSENLPKAVETVVSGIMEAGKAWLQPSDVPTVVAFAETIDLEQQILDVIHSEGLLRANGNGIEAAHPLLKPLIEIRAQKHQLLRALALNPVDRSKLALSEVEGQLKYNKLDEFLSI